MWISNLKKYDKESEVLWSKGSKVRGTSREESSSSDARLRRLRKRFFKTNASQGRGQLQRKEILRDFKRNFTQQSFQVKGNPTENRRGGRSRTEEDGWEQNRDSTRRDATGKGSFRTGVKSKKRFSGELLRKRERRCSETGPGRPSTAVRHKAVKAHKK
ncbi:hypothetical protein NPIL_446091, partial [Nephila pilipes]